MRAMIVSAIRLYRDGLADVLLRRPEFEAVEAASPGEAALDQVARWRPNVVLVDCETASMRGVVGAIQQACLESQIIAIGVSERETDIVSCAEAGVAGFVPRDATIESLIATCQGSLRGEVHCSPIIAAILLRRCQWLAGAAGRPPERGDLSTRELEVVELIDSLSNKEIATRLGIEVATVKNHVHSILEKLRVAKRHDAAALIRSEARIRRLPSPLRGRYKREI